MPRFVIYFFKARRGVFTERCLLQVESGAGTALLDKRSASAENVQEGLYSHLALLRLVGARLTRI